MTSTLSTPQSAALFDILTHYDTYGEIRDFRFPGSLKHYGPPFVTEPTRASTFPALQTLVSRFLLTLPGLKDLPEDFWKVQCLDIIENLENCNLSESYDKGSIGSRKTLATAISALIEYPVRGTYGGFAKVDDSNRRYDTTNAEDLGRSFRDFMDESIYGTVLDDLVKKAAETDDLADHDPLTKAVHEFVLVNLASFMHYTLVLSPKGQYLLKLIDNANKLIPYMMIKQTLRIGNVATMINGLVKIGLAKMSVSSLTNWMGITQTQDEGMNLMQHIISTVLYWDIKDLDTRASKLESERAKLGKDQLAVLKEYATKPREKQEQIRSDSQKNSISIVTAVLRDANLESRLTDPHHTHALEYLNIQLSIRDRKEIINVLCHSTPDHLTQSVRELVSAYEPVIRHAHNAVDLSGTIGDFEYFLRDMLKLAKINTGKDGKESIPTVGDFVQLLRKHQHACHSFIHQCCKNGPEVTSWYLEWAKTAASHFKQDDEAIKSNDTSKSHSVPTGAGTMTQSLQTLFSSLPESTQANIIPVLDAQSAYIAEMHSSSSARLKSVLTCPPSRNPAIAKILSSTTSNGSRPGSKPSSRAGSPLPWSWGGSAGGHQPSSTPTSPVREVTSNPIDSAHETPSSTSPSPPAVSSDPGPGSFLARWQDLLDNTPITPLTQAGQIQKASSAAVVNASTKDVDGTTMVVLGEQEARGDKIRVKIEHGKGMKGGKPDVKVVVEALGDGFRSLLAETSCYW